MEQTSSKTILGAVVLIIIIAGTCGAFAWKYKEKPTETQQDQIQSVPVTNTQIRDVINNTDYKPVPVVQEVKPRTKTNQTFSVGGVSFQYPQNWEIRETNIGYYVFFRDPKKEKILPTVVVSKPDGFQCSDLSSMSYKRQMCVKNTVIFSGSSEEENINDPAAIEAYTIITTTFSK